VTGEPYPRQTVPKTSTDYQPTPLSSPASDETPGPAPAPAEPPAAARRRPRLRGRTETAVAPEPQLPDGIARRTGVIFVHGIGTQQPADTFLEWSGPIVELLTEWRRDLELKAAMAAAEAAGDDGRPPGIPPDVIVDPVRRGLFTFNAASPPYLEVGVPAHAGIPETTLVFTEAWWAADLRAPDLGRTLGYLRQRIRPIVSGIAEGYRSRNANLVAMAVSQGLLEQGKPPLSWRFIDRLDQAQARIFGGRVIGWTIGLAGTGLLLGYDLIRRIPIEPIRDFAARRMIDSFLVDWFGDLPILIDDPVQSANVRGRLAGSIKSLRDSGCDAIVVVAHSGGALVSFETLLDPAYAGPDYKVDKLVTLGQALGLAWRLAADPEVREIAPGHRLVGNLAKARPDLRWVDFWASYDPAPAGPLPARGGLEAAGAVEPEAGPQVSEVVETGEGPGGEAWLVRSDVGTSPQVREATMASVTGGRSPVIEVESRPVTNEMNVLTDHGGYWANDEGFLIPLVRHLDVARGGADKSRFYVERRWRTLRIVWRIQRVAVLATWDWLCSLGAMLSVAILAAAAILGPDRRLATAGDGVAAAWSFVPGHELISGPVDGIGGLIETVASAFGGAAVSRWIGSTGPVLLGIALIVGLFFALAKVGNGRWHDWDRRERILVRPEEPTPPDRRRAAAQAIALIGGLAALLLAVLTGEGGLVIGALVAGSILGLARWIASESIPVVRRPPPG
jgi:hypothetical protein